jgi:enamine deaminase RidA (YjgF/YER057c/UK114 family)
MGITLPQPEITVYDYISLRIHRGVAYVAGQIAKLPGGGLHAQGLAGQEVDFETARESARLCTLQGLTWLKNELGDPERVESVLRLNGYVAAAPGFERISEVVDSASGLLGTIF